jgi:hypothetical protein
MTRQQKGFQRSRIGLSNILSSLQCILFIVFNQMTLTLERRMDVVREQPLGCTLIFSKIATQSKRTQFLGVVPT